MSDPPKLSSHVESGRRIIEAAFDESPSRKMPARMRVFGPDGGSGLVYRLTNGWVYRAINWPDGRRAILEIYLPGDILGLEAAMLKHRPDEVVTITPLTVRAIDTETLAELTANSAAAIAMSWLLVKQQRRIDWLAAALARRDAHERVALMLFEFYNRLRQQGLITFSGYALPLTQQQIGDQLGLTLVYVNRVLHSLRKKKIVSVDRHVVTIHDFDLLRQLATGGGANQSL